MADRDRIKRILKAQIPFPFDIDPFLDRAIREFPEDPASYAYALIINSKAFERRFPGIKRNDGTLRISPAEYINREEQFASTAAQFGFALSRSQVGRLVRNNVDPSEFTLRARGAQLARTNPDLIGFLNQQIRAVNHRRAKAAKGGDYRRIPTIDNPKEAINFFTGRGDRELYALYEGALFQQVAADSGLDITRGRARKLAQRTAGVLDVEQIEEGFSNIAQQVRFAGIELDALGITQRELEILEFGGPGRNDIKSRVEQTLRQRQARISDPQVDPALQIQDGRPVVPTQQG